jgi:hypothetical protein
MKLIPIRPLITFDLESTGWTPAQQGLYSAAIKFPDGRVEEKNILINHHTIPLEASEIHGGQMRW